MRRSQSEKKMPPAFFFTSSRLARPIASRRGEYNNANMQPLRLEAFLLFCLIGVLTKLDIAERAA